MVDGDIQMWLDSTGPARPGFIVPYVMSDRSLTVRYRLRATRDGAGGRAIIGQTGMVTLFPGTPAPLSAFHLSRSGVERCEIEITLSGTDLPQRKFSFECPK